MRSHTHTRVCKCILFDVIPIGCRRRPYNARAYYTRICRRAWRRCLHVIIVGTRKYLLIYIYMTTRNLCNTVAVSTGRPHTENIYIGTYVCVYTYINRKICIRFWPAERTLCYPARWFDVSYLPRGQNGSCEPRGVKVMI